MLLNVTRCSICLNKYVLPYIFVPTVMFPVSETTIAILRQCDGLLKALRYRPSRTCVTRSTTEFLLLSSEGLNNHANRGTIEDVS
jgi:hypothetical protein